MEALDDSLVDSPRDFAAQLAALTPTPGGGAAAARVALFAASLVRMVLGITIAKTQSEEVASGLRSLDDEARRFTETFRALEERDIRSFTSFMEALKLPRGSESQKAARSAARRSAAQECAAVPFELLRSVRDLLELASRVHEAGKVSPLKAASDLTVAGELARAALHAADHTLAANFSELPPGEVESLRREAASIRTRAEEFYRGLS